MIQIHHISHTFIRAHSCNPTAIKDKKPSMFSIVKNSNSDKHDNAHSTTYILLYIRKTRGQLLPRKRKDECYRLFNVRSTYCIVHISPLHFWEYDKRRLRKSGWNTTTTGAKIPITCTHFDVFCFSFSVYIIAIFCFVQIPMFTASSMYSLWS